MRLRRPCCHLASAGRKGAFSLASIHLHRRPVSISARKWTRRKTPGSPPDRPIGLINDSESNRIQIPNSGFIPNWKLMAVAWCHRTTTTTTTTERHTDTQKEKTKWRKENMSSWEEIEAEDFLQLQQEEEEEEEGGGGEEGEETFCFFLPAAFPPRF